MPNRSPLTQVEKERICQGKLQGRTLAELAVEVRCSLACARKWWRRGRDHGLQGLRAPRRGRDCSGILSHFDPSVADKALALKRSHPRWGADHVLVELRRAPELEGLRLGSRNRLAVLFKARCPDCVANYSARAPSRPRPPDVTGVHEMWQPDTQEGPALGDGELELALFDLQRVYDYLATFRFQLKVATNGQVSLGKQHYSVGRRNAGQTLQLCFDPHHAQWVFLSEAGEEIVRRPPKNTSVQQLTGLEPSEHQLVPPVQLTFPCFVA